MEEIKVGEYVRTPRRIDKIIEVKVVHPKMNGNHQIAYKLEKLKVYIEKYLILKHSKNLIDILEVGDFVNYHLIVNKKNDEGKTELGLESDIILNKYIEDNEIINVLTKEQYNQNSYKRNINLKERE